ncbi:MAG: efflux RND transporter permease subunit [Sphaerochaetaceae bacterium]|nr:efflux RND transporter permease subunit [Sphaerochaetaceae bacterium]
MKLSRIGVQKPVAVGIILIAVIAFGIYSLSGTNTEFIADISSPQIIVVTIYPGASAEDVEKDVVKIMEDNFVTIPNIKGIDSTCTNSLGTVNITFKDGIDPYDQLGEVRNRISDMEADLPDNLQGRPEAMVGGIEMIPIVSFTVEGGTDVLALTDYVEDTLKPRITKVAGVSSVDIYGGENLRVNVKLRLDDLAAKGVAPLTVYQLLSYSNVDLPVGTADYRTRSVDLRYDGTYSSIQEIKDLPVGTDEKSHIIHLSDVADISLSKEEAEYFVSNNGKRQMVVEICKRSDGNTVNITKEIKQILSDSSRETNGAVQYNMIQDDSRLVTASLKTVVESGVMGIIVAVLIVYLFIADATATLVIGLSIPLSILFTFIGMRVSGISINLMSLSGMVVALGSIIGGAIVVLEQVYRYYQDTKNPCSVDSAIFRGTDEVVGSVLGSTLTTIVVFIPIALLSGIIGQVLHDVSLTFIYAMTASLIVAIIVVPYLLKGFLKENNRKQVKKSWFLKKVDWLEKKYEKSISWALDYKRYVIVLCLVILALTVYSFTSLSMSFIPSTDNDDFYVTVEFPAGYSLEETKAQMDRVEKLIADSVPEINNAVYYSGKDDSFGSSVATDNWGYGHIVLCEVKERKRDIHEIILATQTLLETEIPDAKIDAKNGGFDRLVSYVSGGGGYGLTLVGTDDKLLYDTAKKLEAELKRDPEVVTTSINTSYDRKSAVIDMSYDYLSSLGVTSYEAGVTSAVLFRGLDVANKFTDTDGERYDIHVYSDATDKPLTNDLLAGINVVSQAKNTVSFASISGLREERTVTQVNHSDRANTVTVSAKVTGESTTGVTARMDEYLASHPLPKGVSTQVGGIGELVNDSLTPMVSALLIAMFLVYIVMVLQFNNYTQPILVMITIPFCIIGVIIALVAFDSTLSLLSMLGIVSLVGMVVNNGILIIDYTNMVRKQGRQEVLGSSHILEDWDSGFGRLSEEDELKILYSSIPSATASRLRPILMTTLSTMLGVVPMAISKGEGAEIYAPLGQSIAGGLLSGSLVTLYLMPVLYYLNERAAIQKKYKKKKEEDGSEIQTDEPEQSVTATEKETVTDKPKRKRTVRKKTETESE